MEPKITLGKYEWVGWEGSVVKSVENDVSIGDVRMIAGKLLFATAIDKHIIFTNRVKWALVDKMATIEQYKEQFMRGY